MGLSLGWVAFSVWVSIPWVLDLGSVISIPFALLVIAGIAYIPGYINAFFATSLLIAKKPEFINENPKDSVTILIAARNEAEKIRNTLAYIRDQDYEGKIYVLIVDNASTDKTNKIAMLTGADLNLNINVILESKPGKYHALNKGLEYIETDLFITLDADTILSKSAVRYIVSRIISAPPEVCAIAGNVLVLNNRSCILTRIQEWDYFLGISSVKKIQGMYEGTLVAQGAYSLYKTKMIRCIGGWPNAIGEDIVMTWRLLSKGYRVYFEPLAIAFTEVPETIKHVSRQRSRWARGMIEGLTEVKPWRQPRGCVKFLTFVNFIMPYLEATFTLCWIPGLILAFFGFYWIVGPTTLLLLPLACLMTLNMYCSQRIVLKKIDLDYKKSFLGFILFMFVYQIIMSPISLWGYFQEIFKLDRVWK